MKTISLQYSSVHPPGFNTARMKAHPTAVIPRGWCLVDPTGLLHNFLQPLLGQEEFIASAPVDSCANNVYCLLETEWSWDLSGGMRHFQPGQQGSCVQEVYLLIASPLHFAMVLEKSVKKKNLFFFKIQEEHCPSFYFESILYPPLFIYILSQVNEMSGPDIGRLILNPPHTTLKCFAIAL